jgi:hypothetical protein
MFGCRPAAGERSVTFEPLRRRYPVSSASLAAFAITATMVGLALSLRLVYFFGLVNVDPFNYADSAISIARWQPALDADLLGDITYTQYIRLSIIAPAALLYRLFGVSDAASTVMPIVLSLVLVGAGGWFGYRLAGAAGAARGRRELDAVPPRRTTGGLRRHRGHFAHRCRQL